MIRLEINNEVLRYYEEGSINDFIKRLKIRFFCEIVVNDRKVEPKDYARVIIRNGDCVRITKHSHCKEMRQV